MKLTRLLIFAVLLQSFGMRLEAQDTATLSRKHWLMPSDTLHKPRLFLVIGGSIAAYTGVFYGLNELWYKGYPRSSFRWINDGGEWLQLDKAGHMITPYQTSRLYVGALRWAGVEQRKAAVYSGLAMFMVSNTIEIFDGFSAHWGASAWDIAANFAGAGLMTAQELIWEEQRISLKLSLTFIDYPSGPPARSGATALRSICHTACHQRLQLN